MAERLESALARLDACHEWPCEYVFKFILPSHRTGELTRLFPDFDPELKKSSKGGYASLTYKIRVGSSREVVEIYEKAGTVSGLVSL